MIKKVKKNLFAAILWAKDYMSQCLLFNGWALFSIKLTTSGSHLPTSPPCNQKHWNCALHRTKRGRNMPLASTDFWEYFWQGGGFGDPKKAKKKKKYWVSNRAVIFHTLLSNILPEASFKLWSVPKCWRVTKFRSTHVFTVEKYQTVWNTAAIFVCYRWKGLKWY